MSVPPQIIRVKRKAREEAPVSFLRVQENKRHRTEAFVYQRKEEPAAFLDIPPNPIIHISAPRDAPLPPTNPAETATFQSSSMPGVGLNSTPSDSAASSESVNANPINSAKDGTTAELRRFHISRKDMLLPTSSQSDRSNGGASRKRAAPAMFVERKIRRMASRRFDKPLVVDDAVTPIPILAADTATDEMEVDRPVTRKLKKPGVAKYAKPKVTEKHKADLPKSLLERWNVDIDTVTADLNAYTMEQIGLNLQKAEDENKARSTAKIQFKYKPKPIKRYAERHPEEAQGSEDRKMVDADADISDSDDGDYIIETYERVPASKMGDHVPAHKIGVLVLDEEPDLDYFYREDVDSEDEWAEDEEDENAENYYAADYPDEEVASDDEFDKNPYSYRTGNASDLEEYDLDDEDDDRAFSDKGEEGLFSTYVGRPKNGFMTNDM
ncbi:hypothetical protein F4804DRAFT_311858 [Jackrogersella minutella]|nr:hypothetical protein F4804DRAFT_311858 [Jackrogersella minutella]